MLAIFGVALALRLAHLAEIRGSALFGADRPPWDAYYYDKVAWAVASGDRWGGPEAAYLTSPPYIAFLAGIYAIFGHDVLAPRVAQAVVGAAVPVLLHLASRRIFGRVAALFTGALAAAYGLFVFYDGELLKTTLGLFGVALALWLLVSARARLGRLFAAGAILGLAALTMGGLSLFVVAAIAWIAWISRHRGARQAALAALALALGAAVVLGPFQLRERLLPEGKSLFAPATGVHFYIGNHAGANGTYSQVPGIRPSAEGHVVDAGRVASQRLGRSVTDAEASRYFRGLALDFMAERPGELALLWMRKIRLFFNAYEIPNNEDYYFTQRASRVLRAPLAGWWLVCPLGLTGMLLCALEGWRARRPEIASPRDRGAALLLALLAATLASTLLAFVTARYRVAAAPALLPFAGLAIARGLEAARARARRDLARGGALALAFAALVNLPTPLPRDQFMAYAEAKLAPSARGPGIGASCSGGCAAHLDEARRRMAAGDGGGALSALEAARREAPESAEVLRLIARVHERAGRIDEAVAVLEAIPAPGPAAAAEIAREVRRLRAASRAAPAP